MSLICGVGEFTNSPVQGLITTGKKGPLPVYSTWQSMLSRCYRETDPAYSRYGGSGVTVHKDWHNFQTFAIWYERNRRLGHQLDKDLFGGSLYGPQTSVYLPEKINQHLKEYNKLCVVSGTKHYAVVANDHTGQRVRSGKLKTLQDALDVSYRMHCFKMEKLVELYGRDLSEEVRAKLLEYWPSRSHKFNFRNF